MVTDAPTDPSRPKPPPPRPRIISAAARTTYRQSISHLRMAAHFDGKARAMNTRRFTPPWRADNIPAATWPGGQCTGVRLHLLQGQ